MMEISVVAAITLGIAGLSYSVLNAPGMEKRATAVAGRASCRTVDAAITAYLAQHGRPPSSIRELAGYVKGDISTYRIVDGLATGPGC